MPRFTHSFSKSVLFRDAIAPCSGVLRGADINM
jgi:hypothetical protein